MDNSEDISTSAFSCKLSDCMDLMGYSFKMVKYRQLMNQRMDSVYNTNVEYAHNTVVTTGGKGEGTAKYFESDIDRMFTLEGVVCVSDSDVTNLTTRGHGEETAEYFDSEVTNLTTREKSAGAHSNIKHPNGFNEIKREIGGVDDNTTVFEVKTQGCSPGYTRLRLKRRADGGYHFKSVELSLTNDADGGVYIKNDFPLVTEDKVQMIDVNGKYINRDDKTGPSMPYSNSHISYDFVNAFMYSDTTLLQEWAKRPRTGDWLSGPLIQKVCQTRGQLVPVGDKNGTHPQTEWRICFTEAELILVRSLSEYQVKVYIVLKVVAKTVLKPICKDISSYAMKNITMWLAERSQRSRFKKETLFDICMEAFMFLRQCIIDGRLGSFIIDERNLFRNRISCNQKRELVSKIDDLLFKGFYMFRDIGKLGTTLEQMDGDRSELKKMSNKRDTVEQLLLQKNIELKDIECEWFRFQNTVEIEDLMETHERYNTLDRQMEDLLVPEKESYDSAEFVDVFKQRLKDTLA